MNPLTAEEIKKAVQQFWSVFLSKSEKELSFFYAPGSIVFQISMGRSEPGRLGAMRRSREYFRTETRMDVNVGPVEVTLVGADAGIATYTFRFQASGRDLGGKLVEENLDVVRGTHVFHRNAEGKLQIVHEHFSVPVI